MKVTGFGGAGWVGRAVRANLAGRDQVRAFDRNPEAWEKWKHAKSEWRDGATVHGD